MKGNIVQLQESSQGVDCATVLEISDLNLVKLVEIRDRFGIFFLLIKISSNHRNMETVDGSKLLSNCEGIDQCLCWMLASTISTIDDWLAQVLCEEVLE